MQIVTRAMLACVAITSTLTYQVASATEPNEKVSGIALENVSDELEPGDNFYEYVNDKWLERTEIPADRSNYGSFSAIDDAVKDNILAIINEAAASEAEQGTDAQKVGDFYKSYMNTELRNELGIRPLLPYLYEVMSISDQEALARVAGQLFRKGFAGPFACYVNVDAKNSKQYAIYLTQTGLTLPDRDYYLKDDKQFTEARAEFLIYAEDMFTAFGYGEAKSAAQRILDLETQLAEIQWTNVENRDPEATYNKTTRDSLFSTLSNFSIEVFLKESGYAEQPEFVVRQPSYLESLNELVASVPLSVWKEFYFFQIIDSAGMDLSEALEKRHFEFHQGVLAGVQEQKPKWRRGVEATESVLGEVLGKLYVEKHFPPAAKQRMDELVGNLKEAFAARIVKLDWMSPVTKKQAHEKLSKFTTKIGYPDKWKDYSKLVIKPDDLVGNYMRAAEIEHQRELDKLGAPIDRDEWFMTPQTINAYYNPTMNEIVFPAAILQPPFFDLNADDAVNYGAIGGVIGHELSHGFDDKGSKFDGDGNLRKWWSVDDRSEFDARAKQLVEQYDAYKPFEDMSVNGELTLGENIGDLGGISVALEAYRLSLGGKEAPKLDGLTGEQRFFMGWGQIWRRKYREPELRQRLLTDPHSPSEYRCNGIVSNLDAFYKAFPIKPSDPMFIPEEDRVRIW